MACRCRLSTYAVLFACLFAYLACSYVCLTTVFLYVCMLLVASGIQSLRLGPVTLRFVEVLLGRRGPAGRGRQPLHSLSAYEEAVYKVHKDLIFLRNALSTTISMSDLFMNSRNEPGLSTRIHYSNINSELIMEWFLIEASRGCHNTSVSQIRDRFGG